MEVLSGIEDMGRAVLEQIVVVLCMLVPVSPQAILAFRALGRYQLIFLSSLTLLTVVGRGGALLVATT